jgi:hypothetical protein
MVFPPLSTLTIESQLLAGGPPLGFDLNCNDRGAPLFAFFAKGGRHTASTVVGQGADLHTRPLQKAQGTGHPQWRQRRSFLRYTFALKGWATRHTRW